MFRELLRLNRQVKYNFLWFCKAILYFYKKNNEFELIKEIIIQIFKFCIDLLSLLKFAADYCGAGPFKKVLWIELTKLLALVALYIIIYHQISDRSALFYCNSRAELRIIFQK